MTRTPPAADTAAAKPGEARPPGFDPSRFAPAAVRCVRLPGGGFELASPIALPGRLDLVCERLQHWVRLQPDRTLFAERSGAGWRSITYGQAERMAAAIAGRLRAISPQLGAERPILILGAASCAQALLRLGALKAGIPFVPASPALLRFDGGERLRRLAARLTPGLLAVAPEHAESAAAALPATELILLDDNVLGAAGDGADQEMQPEPERQTDPDALAAVFPTSGSTGEPKAVAVTQRMIAANQAAYGGVWRFLDRARPVILDWLPWHHTFGGNDNFHKAIWFGGSYHIDDGQPTPERFERSLDNIRAVAPTIHLNVPRGLAMLVERLDNDTALFARFFERLELIFCAGAGLDAGLWRRLGAVLARAADRHGREVALAAGYGTTEAGSTICLVHFPVAEPRVVGLPIPGLTLRLVPAGEKHEVRIKGPMVTPGYWRDPERTAASFDADGFFGTGDAARFVDPADPNRGLVFDGRLGEDFKLSTGTWVSVGPLRLALLAALSPFVRDLLIAGHDRDRLGLILFLDPEAAAARLGIEPDRLAGDPRLRAALAAALAEHNRLRPSSSTAIARAVIDPQPPSAAAGEVSDKGAVNQEAGLRNRQTLIEALFAEPPGPAVILPSPEAETP